MSVVKIFVKGLSNNFALFFNFKFWDKGLRLIFCCFLTPFYIIAEEKRWSVKEIQSVLIQAKAIKLKFQDSKSSFYTFKASEGFSFKLEEGQLKIQSKDFSSKKKWSESQKQLELSFSGPSLPVQLFAGSSEVSFFGWKKALFISSFKAHIELQNTKGKSEINLYEGQALVKNHQGDLKFKAFQTELDLIKSQGVFDFQINKGSLKIKNSGGHLDFSSNDLQLQINDFNGDIKGFAESGELRASLKPKQLELKTGTASVRLYVKGQGSQVSAYTKEGQIYAPRYLNKKYEGKSVLVSGRLRSRVKEGHLKVETERGKIYIH